MGCTVSKLDNEDTVRRCKDRRRLIKAAVHARHHLSAAHFDYCRSLRLTGAALSTFGAGEPLSVYDHAPPVLLRTQSFSSATTTTTTMRPHTPPSYYPPSVPSPSPSPPPPPPRAATAPAAATFATAPNQQHRRKKSMKLPHILSDSSFTSSPKPPQMDYTYNAKANSTYSATPSQASSVWNWENFYPPSPPDSDFFEQLKNKNNPLPNTTSRSQYDEDEEEADKHSRYSAYSRKDKSQNNQHQNASRFPPPNSTSRSHYDEDDEEDKRSRYSAYSRKNESHQHQRQSSTGFPLPNATSRSHYDEDEEEEKLSRYSAYPRKDGSHHNLRQNASGFPHPPATTRSHYDEHEEEDKRSRYSAYSRKEESHHNQPQTTTGFDFFNDDKFSNYSSYSNHSSRNAKNNQWNQGGYRKNTEEIRHLNRSDSGEEDVETEREEVQCSEWGDHDHYSTTSSSSDEEQESRSGISRGSNFRSKTEGFDTASDISKAKTASEKIGLGNSSSFHKGAGDFQGKVEKLYSDNGRSTASWGNKGRGDKEMVSDTRIVVRHKDLAEIVTAIKEYFDKAASAGDQVSAMLEIGRGQLDQSFSNLKKTVYHSSGVFSNLSSSWTSKPPLAVKYKFEPSSLEVSGGPKSLGSTLERLLAWEKKLYQEVKAREGVKIEHEKKLASLQNQEYKGDDDAKLDKTKASIKRLQSLIVVTSQAVSTTSAAIIDQRDSELVPQLVELCHGFMYMWRSMNQFHQVQNDIVQQVRSLVNLSSKGESTSDLHRQAARDLEAAVSSWHSSFCRLIKFKRDFIRSLHGWFKLSLIPINNDEPTNSSKVDSSEAFAFSDEWKLALERVPDTVASEAIKSFINVVHSISLKQTEELKIKKRTESVSKELEKKASSLRNIEKKYYNSYSLVGIGLPDTGLVDNGHALDARDPLAEKKLELSACQRRVEDEMVKHSKAVEVTRSMTLNNIQTGLPGVFQAMTSFSALFTDALEVVCTRSYAIK